MRNDHIEENVKYEIAIASTIITNSIDLENRRTA